MVEWKNILEKILKYKKNTIPLNCLLKVNKKHSFSFIIQNIKLNLSFNN
jgi:hypothetical protein